MRKKNRLIKYMLVTLPIVVTVFIVLLIYKFYTVIKENPLLLNIILWVLGGIIVVYILIGIFKWKKFVKGFKKKL